VNDEQLIQYANGSYSPSDWGCAGDTIAISPRPFPVPGFLREYVSWAKALQEATDICALQNGPCWLLRARDIGVRCGQRAGGGCPTCLPAPGVVQRHSGMSGLTPGSTITSGFPDEVRREVQRRWDPVAVVTDQGVAKVLPDGCVLPLWDRVFFVSPPDRLVHEQAGLLYNAAVRAAQVIAAQTGRPRVIGARTSRGDTVAVTYVDPGGIVRAMPEPRGTETNVTTLDPLEVRQFFAASRGASLMPWGM
jgi:hypothetical protein